MGLIGGGLRPWSRTTLEGHALVVSEDCEAQVAATRGRRAWLPPRWFVVMFWHGHRVLLRVTRGRLGFVSAQAGRLGGAAADHDGPAHPAPGKARLARRRRALVTLLMPGREE